MSFEQALDFYLSLLEEQPEGISSVSISFYEEWTGEKHNYILDTLYPTVDPRVHSLATAHVVEHVDIPRKREELTEEVIAKLEAELAKEFATASKALDAELAEEVSTDDGE